jgi:hypothetical protein
MPLRALERLALQNQFDFGLDSFYLLKRQVRWTGSGLLCRHGYNDVESTQRIYHHPGNHPVGYRAVRAVRTVRNGSERCESAVTGAKYWSKLLWAKVNGAVSVLRVCFEQKNPMSFEKDRRTFLTSAAAATTVAGTSAAEAAARPPVVGIQIGSDSFLDEGMEKVLDILQEKTAVNTLFSPHLPMGTESGVVTCRPEKRGLYRCGASPEQWRESGETGA